MSEVCVVAWTVHLSITLLFPQGGALEVVFMRPKTQSNQCCHA